MTRRFLSAILGLALAVTASTQDDAAAKTGPDPVVAEKLKVFEAAIKDRKAARDAEAVGIIDELMKNYDDLDPKDQTSFVKALGKAFKSTNRKRQPEDMGLYTATASALGTIGGSSSSRLLVAAYGRNPFKKDDWVALRGVLLENIGKTKEEKQIEFLLDRARQDKDDSIKKSAGWALRHYGESKFKVRVQIVKKLVPHYAEIEGQSKTLQSNDPTAATRQRTLRAISDPWNETLSALTTQEFRTAEQWQHWYNKNKSKPKAWGGKS